MAKSDTQIIYEKACSLLAEGKYSEAEAIFDMILEMEPTNLDALFGKAKCLYLQGMISKATELFNRLKTNPNYSDKIADFLGKPLEEKKSLEEKKEVEKPTLTFGRAFVARYLKVEERIPSAPAPQPPSDILMKIETELAVQPDDWNLWFQKGQALLADEKLAPALDAFEKSLSLKPDERTVLNVMAEVLTKLGRFEEAAKCYWKVVEGEGKVVERAAPAVEEIDVLLEDVIKEVTAPKPSAKPVVAKPEVKAFDIARELAELEKELEVPSVKIWKPAKAIPLRHAPPTAVRRAMPPPPPRPTPTPTHGGQLSGFVNGTGALNAFLNSTRLSGRLVGLNGIVARRSRLNGTINGRGRLNGWLNGKRRLLGSINGRGRLKGTVNGRNISGYLNGFVAHIWMRHSLVNGRGGTNGFSNGRAAVAARRRVVSVYASVWDTFAVLAVIGLILSIGAILYLPPYMAVKINIDGDFTDWYELPGFYSSASTELDPNIDIVNYSAYREYGLNSFYVRVRGKIFMGGGKMDTLRIFMDCDGSCQTGYRIKGIGADYMLQISGYGNNISSAKLLVYDTRVDKNGFGWCWADSRKVSATVKGSELETQFYGSDIGLAEKNGVFLLHFQNWRGEEDYSDTLFGVANRCLIVEQKSLQNEVVPAMETDMLQLTFKAIGGMVKVNRIAITKVGDAQIKTVRCGGESAGFETSGNNAVIKFKDFVVSPDKAVTLNVSVDLSTARPYQTAGVKINSRTDVAGDGVVTLKSDLENYVAYVAGRPAEIKIDSAFGDWKKLDTDLIKDCPSPNIDITHFAISNEDDRLSFYIRVDGEFCGGTAVPVKPEEVPPPPQPVGPLDTDRDTMPDEIDPYPYDFDNDGTPDAEENNDVDSDGLKDSPFGDDFYLETTIPAQPPFPKEYWGRRVVVELQPPPPPAPIVIGEDCTFIFMDTDCNAQTGYKISTIGADYMLNITGKNQMLLKKRFFEYNGTADGSSWNWLELKNYSIAAEFDTRQLEVMIKKPPSAGTVKIYFMTSDWSRNKDSTEETEKSVNKPLLLSGASATDPPLRPVVSGTGAQAEDKFGFNVSWAGDVNNDGYSDVIIGAPYADYGGTEYTVYDTGTNSMSYPFAGGVSGVDAARVQMLFNQSEIGQGGIIDKVYLYKQFSADPGVFRNFRMYLCHAAGWPISPTFANNYKAGETPTLVLANQTLTFTSSDAAGWYAFDVANTFVYNNVDPLLVELRWNGDNGNTVEFYAENIAGCRRRVYENDDYATTGSSGASNDYEYRLKLEITSPTKDNGCAYIFYGYPGMTADKLSVVYANQTLFGRDAGDHFGWSVSDAGDVNGDGYDDVIIGAPDANNGRGKAYVYSFGTGLFTFDDFQDNNYDSNPKWNVQAGGWTAVNGYLEGDDTATDDRISTSCEQAYGTWEFKFNFEVVGNNEYVRLFLIMSADSPDPNGAGVDGYYVFVDGGTTAGSRFCLKRCDDATATNIITADWTPAPVSWHTVKVTRYRNNTFALYLNGTIKGWSSQQPKYQTSYYMGIWNSGVVAGNNHRIDDIKITHLTITGEAPGDRFGSSVATAGDVNGDNIDDVIVGAHLNDNTGKSNNGRSYIYYGGATMGSSKSFSLGTAKSGGLYLGNSAAYQKQSQSFTTLSFQRKICKVLVGLSKTGSPTADITISIRSGLAETNLVSTTVTASQITSTSATAPTEIVVRFAYPLDVAASTTYYLVFETTQNDAANYYNITYDSNAPYGGGQVYKTTSDTADSTIDLYGMAYYAYADENIFLNRKVDNGEFGFSVSTAGNVNGDANNRADVLVGEPGADTASVYLGSDAMTSASGVFATDTQSEFNAQTVDSTLTVGSDGTVRLASATEYLEDPVDNIESFEASAEPEWGSSVATIGEVAIVTTTAHTGTQSIRVYDNSATSSSFLYHTNAATKTGDVTTWVKPSATNKYLYVRLIEGSYSGGTSALAVRFAGDGTLEYEYPSGTFNDFNPVITYAAATWYELKYVYDCTTDTFDFYLNGSQKLNDQAFATAVSYISTLRYGTASGDTASEWFADDVSWTVTQYQALGSVTSITTTTSSPIGTVTPKWDASNAYTTTTSVTPGDGAVSDYWPLNADDGHEQDLILASQIGTAGIIDKIAVYKTDTSSATYNKFRIYLSHTTATTLGTSFSANYQTYTRRLVFGPADVTFPASTGWFEINLDNEFLYDGTNNLIVEHMHNGRSAATAITVKTTSGTNRAAYKNDIRNDDATQYGEYVYFKIDIIPNIKVEVSNDGGVNWYDRTAYNDVDYAFPTNGRALKYRYTFYGGSATPVLNCMKLSYCCKPDVLISGTAGTQFGYSVSNASDLNVASPVDIIIGAPASTNGNAYIYFGSTTWGSSVFDISTANVTLSGASGGDKFGFSVSWAGDVGSETSPWLGDNIPDVIVGAPYNDNTASDAGAVYVFCGGAAMDSVADFTYYGETANDHFGFSVCGAGDMNGDGYDDVIVGAPDYDDSGKSNAGKAYIFCYIPEFKQALSVAVPVVSICIVVYVVRYRRRRQKRMLQR